MFRGEQESIQQQIYALRYQAYLGNKSITPNEQQLFSDHYDEAENCHSHIEYIDGEPAGSIRISVYDPRRPDLEIPSMENFSAELFDALGDDKIFVEASKFAINPKFQAKTSILKFALWKHIYEYALAIKADYILGEPQPKHMEFYTKYMMMKPISSVKSALHLNFDTVLLACPLPQFLAEMDSNPKYRKMVERFGLA